MGLANNLQIVRVTPGCISRVSCPNLRDLRIMVKTCAGCAMTDMPNLHKDYIVGSSG